MIFVELAWTIFSCFIAGVTSPRRIDMHAMAVSPCSLRFVSWLIIASDGRPIDFLQVSNSTTSDAYTEHMIPIEADSSFRFPIPSNNSNKSAILLYVGIMQNLNYDLHVFHYSKLHCTGRTPWKDYYREKDNIICLCTSWQIFSVTISFISLLLYVMVYSQDLVAQARLPHVHVLNFAEHAVYFFSDFLAITVHVIVILVSMSSFFSSLVTKGTNKWTIWY